MGPADRAGDVRFCLSQVRIDPSNLGPSMQWLLRTGGVVVAGFVLYVLSFW